jgi:mono/diheme cytochrome c family protein
MQWCCANHRCGTYMEREVCSNQVDPQCRSAASGDTHARNRLGLKSLDARVTVSLMRKRIRPTVFAAILFCLPQHAYAQITALEAQNVLAGSRVFGSRGCNRCHAINGLGGDLGSGPDLASVSRPQSFYGFGAAMWNHLPTMVAQMRALGIDRPRLTPWETGDLIAFLFWLDYFGPAGDTLRGRGVFTEKSCITCHQVGNVGGVMGPSLDFLNQYGSPVQIAAAMWNHGPAMSATMAEMGIQRPTFVGSELIDLIAFLKSATARLPEVSFTVLPGRPDAGRELFENKSCPLCHSVSGRGGKAGPDLGAATRRSSLIEFAAAMWNKAPAMTLAMERDGITVPELRAEEMADILAYLSSIQYSAESGDATRGGQVLRAKRCLDCHAVSGRGARLSSDLAQVSGLTSHAGVISALWNHVLISEQPGVENRAWPTMTSAEMADLAAYLGSLGGNP